MRYLVFIKGEAFYSERFDRENHYQSGMIVFDLSNNTFTRNGYDWEQIEFDHL